MCRYGLLLQTEWRDLCLSICLSVTIVSFTAEPIEIPFEMLSGVGLGNHVLDGRFLSPVRRGSFKGEGKGRPVVKYVDCLS